MASIEPSQFEVLWQQAQREPRHKQVETQKRNIDFSLGAMIDRFLLLAERASTQGKINKEAYENLVVQSDNMKKALAAINEKELIATEIAERAKRRALQRGR
jgi:hypothetical protein